MWGGEGRRARLGRLAYPLPDGDNESAAAAPLNKRLRRRRVGRSRRFICLANGG